MARIWRKRTEAKKGGIGVGEEAGAGVTLGAAGVGEGGLDAAAGASNGDGAVARLERVGEEAVSGSE